MFFRLPKEKKGFVVGSNYGVAGLLELGSLVVPNDERHTKCNTVMSQHPAP